MTIFFGKIFFSCLISRENMPKRTLLTRARYLPLDAIPMIKNYGEYVQMVQQLQALSSFPIDNLRTHNKTKAKYLVFDFGNQQIRKAEIGIIDFGKVVLDPPNLPAYQYDSIQHSFTTAYVNRVTGTTYNALHGESAIVLSPFSNSGPYSAIDINTKELFATVITYDKTIVSQLFNGAYRPSGRYIYPKGNGLGSGFGITDTNGNVTAIPENEYHVFQVDIGNYIGNEITYFADKDDRNSQWAGTTNSDIPVVFQTYVD